MFHGHKLRPVEIEEVTKMLECRTEKCGFAEYYCSICNEPRTIYFGCNSRICSICGKSHTDRWAKSLSQNMFDVVHRHVVLSLPDRMWGLFLEDRDLLKVLMDSAIETLNAVLSHSVHKKVRVGAIVVLHPFSRDLSLKPHIHILMTEGGFDRKGNFIEKKYIPFEAMRKVWQYTVLSNIKRALPATKENAVFIDRLFKDYPDGFYAHLPLESRITSKRKIAKYIGRYVRHPAIANYRLCGYDGKSVTFWYKDNQEVMHYKTMDIFELIKAIIQHIPEGQFKMIRHYGAYSRNLKKKYQDYLPQRSITQLKLDDIGINRLSICPNCGTEMDLIFIRKKGPPESHKFRERLSEWAVLEDRGLTHPISLTE